MGGNISKAPLAAIFYAGLLGFIAGMLPQSETYAELTADFTMSLTGTLFLAVYGLWICLALAIVFGGAKSKGIVLVLFSFLTLCGVQWVAPLLPQILLGEPTGVLARSDLLMKLAGGCGGSLLLLLLLMLVYKSGGQPEVKRKLKPLGLIIRLLVLPVLFFIAYYLTWYFLLWTVDSVRDYYGQPELQNFMGEVINILVEKGSQAVVVLLQGFAYGLFSLPLLLQLPGKRILFIIANMMLYTSGALIYLIPNPVMPDDVRTAHLVQTAALMAVYGILSGVMLHTAYKKEVAAAPAKAAAKPKAKPAEDGGKDSGQVPAVAGAKK